MIDAHYLNKTQRTFDTKHELNKLDWETTLYKADARQYTYQNLLSLYEFVYLLLKFDTVKHENDQNKEILHYRTPGKTRSP